MTDSGVLSLCTQEGEHNENWRKHSSIKHQTFQLQYCCLGQTDKQTNLLAWGGNTSLDFDKAMGDYLQEELPEPVKNGHALLK